MSETRVKTKNRPYNRTKNQRRKEDALPAQHSLTKKAPYKAGYIDARPHPPHRRNLLHRTAGPYMWVNVTAHPTADWIAQQISEAFPWDEAPRYLIRDRDGAYGTVVTRRLRAMGI